MSSKHMLIGLYSGLHVTSKIKFSYIFTLIYTIIKFSPY
uniref:Uncharacterized protein n=1 Tax=Anguilla anguilla TaxID=7936 RepID=A0A0E9S1D4_ANGAN